MNAKTMGRFQALLFWTIRYDAPGRRHPMQALNTKRLAALIGSRQVLRQTRINEDSE
jgi:hypothetical protein